MEYVMREERWRERLTSALRTLTAMLVNRKYEEQRHEEYVYVCACMKQMGREQKSHIWLDKWGIRRFGMRLSSIHVHCMLWSGQICAAPLKPNTHMQCDEYLLLWKNRWLVGRRSHKRHNHIHILFLKSCSLCLSVSSLSCSPGEWHVRWYSDNQALRESLTQKWNESYYVLTLMSL